jgi:hypothetical protein
MPALTLPTHQLDHVIAGIGWEEREKDYLSAVTEGVRRLTRQGYSLERYRERDHKRPSQCFKYNHLCETRVE